MSWAEFAVGVDLGMGKPLVIYDLHNFHFQIDPKFTPNSIKQYKMTMSTSNSVWVCGHDPNIYSNLSKYYGIFVTTSNLVLTFF